MVLPCPALPSAPLDKSDSLQSDLALPPFPPAYYLPALTIAQQKCMSPEKLDGSQDTSASLKNY